MKAHTKLFRAGSSAWLATLILTSIGTMDLARAQDAYSKSCGLPLTGLWIIGDACDLGSSTNLQSNDAIDIQCDSQTGRWSVDFYQEPAGADPNDPVSQATRIPLCPGNGRVVSNADGELVLSCSYWESTDNVARELVIQPQPSTQPNVHSMSWLARDLDNPNVVCGIHGRPDAGTGVGSGGQT